MNSGQRQFFNRKHRRALFCAVASLSMSLICPIQTYAQAPSGHHLDITNYGRDQDALRSLNFGRIGYIDRKGRVVVAPMFYGAGDFSANGLAPVDILPATEESPTLTKWGYVDTSGRMVIPAGFLGAGEFDSDGRAIVRRNDGTYDFIDARGEFTTAQHFLSLRIPSGTHKALNSPEFLHSLVPAEASYQKWGFVGSAGQWIIPPKYEDVGYFSNDGLADVLLHGKWIYIDAKDRIARSLPDRLGHAGHFNDGLAYFDHDDNCGYVDRNGKVAISPRFYRCEDFGSGAPFNMARVELRTMAFDPDHRKDQSLNGLIDTRGRFVLRPSNFSMYHLGEFSPNGLRPYSMGGPRPELWGYIDTSGRTIVQPQFLFAGDFKGNGLARVVAKNSRSGFINANGTYVIPAEFDCAGDFAPDGLARARRQGQWGFIDASGTMVVKTQYIPVSDFSPTGYAQVADVTESSTTIKSLLNDVVGSAGASVNGRCPELE